MKAKRIITSIILAIVLMISGTSIFVVGVVGMGFDFGGFATLKYVNNSYQFSEEVSAVNIDVSTARVAVLPSEDGVCRVECFETEHKRYVPSVEGGVLVIKEKNEGKWYNNVGIASKTPTLTVYLPGAEYSSLVISSSTGDIKISDTLTFGSIEIDSTTSDVECFASADNITVGITTGDITLDNIKAKKISLGATSGDVSAKAVECSGDIDIRVGTGDVELLRVTCATLSSVGTTGDIELAHVNVGGLLNIKRTTGSVELDRCDAGEIVIRTNSGDVEGTLLSDKVFSASTTTGRISVPHTSSAHISSGASCDIQTTTGDIRIKISE